MHALHVFKIFRKYLESIQLSGTASNPLDTGRKLNVHKTFNLRPVSGENKWEH